MQGFWPECEAPHCPSKSSVQVADQNAEEKEPRLHAETPPVSEDVHYLNSTLKTDAVLLDEFLFPRSLSPTPSHLRGVHRMT